MKKVLIVFLVFAYLNCYMGCTTTKVTTHTFDEFDKSNNDKSITLMSKDSIKYHFDANMYRFLNDTINGVTEINGKSQRIKLAKPEIVSIANLDNRLSTGGWIITGFVLIGLGYLLVILIGEATGKEELDAIVGK